MRERMKRVYYKIASTELDGIGIIEIILILVIIIGLVVIFRSQISDILTKAFTSITDNAATINEEIDIP